MKPSPIKVAFQHVADSLSGILRDLQLLEELDQNLQAVEMSFDSHFPGTVTASVIDPNITSQMEILKKAQSGLKAAQEMKEKVTSILAAYPDDRLAQRALTDADKMVLNFTKHQKNAVKIISTIGKKQMPPALKAYAKKVEAIILRRLVDPNKLQVIPWVTIEKSRVEGEFVDTQLFRVIFRIEDEAAALNVGREREEPLTWKKVELWVAEWAIGPGKVTVYSENHGGLWGVVLEPQATADKFFEKLRGWSGIKGEADATQSRASVAQSIASAIDRACSSMSREREKAEVSHNNLNVYGSYKSDLPKDGRSDVGHGDYDEMVEKELSRFRKVLDPLLAPHKSSIKRISVGDEEKSWISVDVELA